MKKLILSAFALSLLAPSGLWGQTEAVDSFLGLESEVLPELVSDQKFTTSNLHQHSEWKVEEKEAVIDKEPLKGQKYSLIPWSELDPDAWMSIDRWLLERKEKDKIPDWKIRIRDDRHLELVGKILKCQGTCPVYRGTNSSNVQHLSQIVEGDELRTEKDSIAWVYLMDGTLVRLGPESSLSFQETNWSKGEVFYLARLNQGHVYWHARDKKALATDEAPETDAMSVPLLVKEANTEFYEREIFKKQTEWERLTEVHSLFDNAIKKQFEAINSLKEKNNPSINYTSKVMLVAPNASIVAKDTSFDLMFYPGGKSFFKRRSIEGSEFRLQLRGYNQTEMIEVEPEWYEVDHLGRSHTKLDNPASGLQMAELLTRRIKTLELAREIWLEKFTVPVANSLGDAKKLAVEHGYTLWGDDLFRRYDFLTEYTRRLETTNIKSLDNLLTKLEENGEKVNREMTDSHFRASLNFYLLGLKKRYTDKKMQIREMNDLQYYVWILKNGKI